MSPPDRFVCTVTLAFDPWGHAQDPALEVLLPLPADDGYQRVLGLDALPGRDVADVHGRSRLIRLDRGQVATVTARVETLRLGPDDRLNLPPPSPADRGPAPMILPDPALHALADRAIAGIVEPGARIAALARAAAGALRYRYPRAARGAALSLARGWGDCGEYAFVFVALCHHAGIPARPVFGLITAPWMVTPHAWAEAWDGKSWRPVDPNLVREGGYLGPLLDSDRAPEGHIGALDPYRLVLSRHTGLPWPGNADGPTPPPAPGLTLTLEGLGPVPFWHAAPRWQGAPVVPFLQMPWTVIRHPAPATAGTLLRRLRPWRVAVRQPSRRLPRSPWALADLVALHPLKGTAGVLAATLAIPLAPPLAPALQAAIWGWLAVFGLGFLRHLRLVRLRSALWLWIEAALRGHQPARTPSGSDRG